MSHNRSAGEARRETRAKQAKPVGFEPPRSLGETRAKQGGPVGNLVQRCTPSKKSGSPRDAEEAVGHRKPGCRNRVQNFAETHKTLGPCSALFKNVASWGASLCITLYIVAILAILTFLFVPLFPPSNLLPVLRCPTCDKASCGIRTHDLPLTERVLYQLS